MKTPKEICADLSPQNGKVLRYIVDRGVANPVTISNAINYIPWSDLPHSYFESKRCFDELRRRKLIVALGHKFVPTDLGKEVMAYANKKRLWQRPSSSKTMNSRRNK